MTQEINREITKEGKVKVTYDDGSVEFLKTPQTYPENVTNDKDADPSMNTEKVFLPEELQ